PPGNITLPPTETVAKIRYTSSQAASGNAATAVRVVRAAAARASSRLTIPVVTAVTTVPRTTGVGPTVHGRKNAASRPTATPSAISSASIVRSTHRSTGAGCCAEVLTGREGTPASSACRTGG